MGGKHMNKYYDKKCLLLKKHRVKDGWNNIRSLERNRSYNKPRKRKQYKNNYNNMTFKQIIRNNFFTSEYLL